MMARPKPSHRASTSPTPTPRPGSPSADPVRTHLLQTQIHQGPLPHPEILRQYDQLASGAAERIIAMAEAEALHRRTMEHTQLASDVSHREVLTQQEDRRVEAIFASDKLGQALGAAVSVAAIAAAAGSAWAGLAYGIDSQWYWAIPIALVSLPVLGMVKAIRSRPESNDANSQTHQVTDSRG